ncbi:MAG: L-threonine dehydratase catabolic TdcB [Gemmatimonadaceae bacterium]|nr:L-threonine dehydratase catabolic TdcB [Gemmatimonadaceae bacterium]
MPSSSFQPGTRAWPISLDDVRAAEARIRPYLAPTACHSYPVLDAEVGSGIRVRVKHENFQPTGSFKIRNGVSFMTALTAEQRARGVVAATRGNHGLGVAFAGQALGVRTTICVPVGNNPDKNAGMTALGARLIEDGRDYDDAVLVAERIVREESATIAHSTNDRTVVAGAGTLTLELIGQCRSLDAMVLAVGGGSQAVGAMTVLRALRPGTPVYAVQAEGASAAHDGVRAGHPVSYPSCNTFADGLATRSTYDLTFPALLDGLADFITVTDAEIAHAMRVLLRTTHSLVEPAGAAGLAGLLRLRETLAGKTVSIVLSGANVDEATLRHVLS